QGVLRYLAKGVLDPYSLEPEEADWIYRALQGTQVTRASDGLLSLAPPRERSHGDPHGPLPADRGEVVCEHDGIVALHTGEVIQPSGRRDQCMQPRRDSSAALTIEEESPAQLEEMLRWELELMGQYVSGHPMD